ncbi:glycoside hydrolase family 3 C-terminal domain-containing protein [bacterium RCC_150]
MIDLNALTLEEKASLASGGDFWTTKAVAGVPSIMLTDGPHGLRKQGDQADHLGINASIAATCFPPASGIGQSWNVGLISRIAGALGRECRAENVGVLLGPGVNIRRSPLGGRNFEYFSEDPILSAALGTAWVKGIQAEGVGASLKHYALNNQENDRQRVSSDIDPRPLREIYLRAFQRVVEEAKPWTVMSSYNRVNGEYVGESEYLLTKILRDEWGFDGVVLSDWGAVVDRVASASAGLDLEMPSSGGTGDRALVAAVQDNRLSEDVVDRIAQRIAELAFKAATAEPLAGFNVEEHHALAREAAAHSIVLLKNDDGLLPLKPGASIAVIGEFAERPRYQGGGSSHVNPTKVDGPLEELRLIGGADSVTYSRGFASDGTAPAGALLKDAVEAARAADVAVLFLGLPDELESEGWDREDIELPGEQIALAHSVYEANPRTVVVLTHGGVVRLAPIAGLPAILDGALLGQGAGHAIASVIYGAVNPSGRLTETVPERIQDTPAFLNFPGEHSRVRYAEGLYVGYRWYDAREIPVTFPFGHGLSYTTFEYSNLELTASEDGIHASVTVTNTGGRAGRDVPQFYVSVPNSQVQRPLRELKGFGSIDLDPGEEARLDVLLRRSDLAFWDTRIDGWVVETGAYEVTVGASSRDLRLIGTIDLSGDAVVIPLSSSSTIEEFLENPLGAEFVNRALKVIAGAVNGSESATDRIAGAGSDTLKMMASFPIGRMINFTAGALTSEQIDQVLAAANAAAIPASAANV